MEQVKSIFKDTQKININSKDNNLKIPIICEFKWLWDYKENDKEDVPEFAEGMHERIQ